MSIVRGLKKVKMIHLVRDVTEMYFSGKINMMIERANGLNFVMIRF